MYSRGMSDKMLTRLHMDIDHLDELPQLWNAVSLKI